MPHQHKYVDVRRYNMKTLLVIITFISSATLVGQSQKDFLVVQEDTSFNHKFKYFFLTPSGDTVTRLDTSNYYVCFSDTVQAFAIVGLKNKKGWWAIDRNEKILFQVYNTSVGEPSPDELQDGMIRIVDNYGKIGFANQSGQIVIKPKFEAASSFYKGKAIIGRQCKQVLWCCKGDNEDKHYLMQCQQTGYIDGNGQIKKIGNYTFDQIQKELKWPLND